MVISFFGSKNTQESITSKVLLMSITLRARSSG